MADSVSKLRDGESVASRARQQLGRATATELTLRIEGKRWTVVVGGEVFRVHVHDVLRELANPSRVLRALTATAAAKTAAAPHLERIKPSPARRREPLFRLHDDVWEVGYAGTTTFLPHGRGLALLAHLIDRPGQHIHVRDLECVTRKRGDTDDGSARAAIAERIERDLGDNGPLLDARAKREYRCRIADLDAEIAAAERCGELGRLERLRTERAFVVAQLRAAVGLGGRDRPNGSAVERMRVAITRRIRAAVGQIASRHAELGMHLVETVRTGYCCAYLPDIDG